MMQFTARGLDRPAARASSAAADRARSRSAIPSPANDATPSLRKSRRATPSQLCVSSGMLHLLSLEPHGVERQDAKVEPPRSPDWFCTVASRTTNSTNWSAVRVRQGQFVLPWRSSLASWRSIFTSVIEHKLRRVDKGPHYVFGRRLPRRAGGRVGL